MALCWKDLLGYTGQGRDHPAIRKLGCPTEVGSRYRRVVATKEGGPVSHTSLGNHRRHEAPEYCAPKNKRKSALGRKVIVTVKSMPTHTANEQLTLLPHAQANYRRRHSRE